MIKCPNCARDNADNFNFCLDCGYDLKALREAFSPATVAPSSPPPPPPRAPSSSTPPSPQARVEQQPAATLAAAPTGWPPPSSAPQTAAPAVSRPSAPPAAAAPATVPPSAPPRPQVAPPSPVTIPPAAAPQPPAALSTTLAAPATLPPLAAVPTAAVPPAAVPPAAVPPAATSIVPLPPPAAAPTLSAPPRVSPGTIVPQNAGPGVSCPACGYQNATTVRFCGDCGKRLDGVDAAAGADGGQNRTMFMHAASSVPAVREPICRLVTIDQTGREGMTFTLRSGETVCGRTNGVVLFDDPYVSPTHCRFVFTGGKLHVHDQGSLNGVYLRVRGERLLADGDYLRVGRQLFRFESLAGAALQVQKADDDDSQVWGSPHPAAFGRVIQVLDDGRTGEIRLFSGERCQLGREQGDIVIPSDGFISGKHCAFLRQGADVMLQDLGSSNGTYVRVRGEAEVAHGDFLLVGNQMLRVEIV